MCAPQYKGESRSVGGYNPNRLKRVGYFRRKYQEAQAPLMLALSLVVVMASASGQVGLQISAAWATYFRHSAQKRPWIFKHFKHAPQIKKP
jgi:hypothetical protein